MLEIIFLVQGTHSRRINSKPIHVRLAIVEMMNDKILITVRKISERTKISITSIRNYVQDLEHTGELYR